MILRVSIESASTEGFRDFFYTLNGARVHLSAARDSRKRRSRIPLPVAPAYTAILDAGLALRAGDAEPGEKHLRAAVAGFDEYEIGMFAAASRRRLGELIGGDEGRELLAQGDAAMRAQRIVNLDAITEMLIAGCRAL